MNQTTERAENTEWKHDPLTSRIIGCAIEVHQYLGPGLLESTYERCLAHELHLAGLKFTTQTPVPVYYKGIDLDCGYRADLIVENVTLLELTAKNQVTSTDQAQVLTYMTLAELHVGLLINFNVKLLKDGIRRFAI